MKQLCKSKRAAEKIFLSHILSKICWFHSCKLGKFHSIVFTFKTSCSFPLSMKVRDGARHFNGRGQIIFFLK
jgi:hypothetical protein